MQPKGPGNAMHRFFCGIAEFVFQTNLGVADPPLIDYISDMLCRFVRQDALLRIRNAKGRRVDEVPHMVAEADARLGLAKRAVHRHIGDFTLFWTGVYPEALSRLKARDRTDFFVDYCQQGKRAYMLAAQIATDREEEDAPGDVLERLSHEFEMCAFGLGEIRREWEGREDGPKPPILA